MGFAVFQLVDRCLRMGGRAFLDGPAAGEIQAFPFAETFGAGFRHPIFAMQFERVFVQDQFPFHQFASDFCVHTRKRARALAAGRAGRVHGGRVIRLMVLRAGLGGDEQQH